MDDDSIESIFKAVSTCALISKSAGGVGLHIHCIRATNSYIRGTNGVSNGLVPMLRVFNNVARYVDQGGNKVHTLFHHFESLTRLPHFHRSSSQRPGAFAVYLEPWHADIFDFLELRKNSGDAETRCRDLFFGLWIPDEFMRRVESDGKWSLMCPDECPGLYDCWGEEFDNLYQKYALHLVHHIDFHNSKTRYMYVSDMKKKIDTFVKSKLGSYGFVF